MSVEIEKSFVQQYKSNVMMLLQQKGSKLRSTVRIESQSAEYAYYDQLGQTQAQPVLGRHTDTPLVSTPHDRRRVGMIDYDWADLIDKKDLIRNLIDPTSPYATNASWAIGRAMDDVIINALFGTAYTGKDGSTTVAFPASQQIAVNDHSYDSGSGNVGLTIGKLIAARTLIKKAEIMDDEEIYIVVNAAKMSDLLTTTQVTSADYNTVKALVNGQIDTFLGFKFVHCERILTNASSQYRVPVYTKNGLLLAMGEDISVSVDKRTDKRNSTQVYASATFGATRLEEKRVVEIICT